MAVTSWEQRLIIPRDADGLLADPYYEWARTTGFEYYGRSVEWLPVLIELRKGGLSAKAFAERVFEMQALSLHAQGWAANLRVPRFYAAPPPRLKRPMRFLAVLATKQFLWDVYKGKEPADWISRFELGRATALSGLGIPPTTTPSPPSTHMGTPTVVTGVIDDGIAFAHDRFWSTDGKTRIEYFWDQLEPSVVLDGDWGYGREITKRDPIAGIDKRMGDSRYNLLVDEDEVYRRSGHVDHAKPGHKPLASRAAHGAHVMDLACFQWARPAPGVRPIVAVQLPVATVEDTSGATLGPQIYNGLCYIVAKAAAIANDAGSAPLPVVANVSYGTIAGPHDGKSVLEAAMDHLIEICDPPLRVVLPAGNNHLSRCHARFSLAPSKSHELAWRVLPDDWTESHLEIWLRSGTNPSLITISVTAPDGTTSTGIAPGDELVCRVGSDIVAQASYYPPGAVVNPSTRALVRLSLAPTGSPSAGVPLAPAGLWRVKLSNDAHVAVSDIHAWIQRDDTAPGYKRRSRQSHFDDPKYRRHDDGGRAIEDDNDPRTTKSYVKRRHTLNAIATGKKTFVVGGFRRSDWAPAPYSACGPALPPGRSGGASPGPDAMWPTEEAPAHHGVLGAGTRSGSCVAMNGTSVAAPLAARWVAEQWVTGPSIATVDRDKLFSFAQSVDIGPSKPKRERGGGGRVPAQPVRRPPRREV